MDPAQMLARCPAAAVIGVAFLPGHRFIVNSRGVATAMQQDGSPGVYGVLWSVDAAGFVSLDRAEGVEAGVYRRHTVRVRTEAGEVGADAYFATVTAFGPPRPAYLDRVIRGAEHFNLPATYVQELRQWHSMSG